MLELAKALLDRGARPDVLIRFDGLSPLEGTLLSCLAVFCVGGYPGMEPLLELLLAVDYTPALDLNAACASRHDGLGNLVCYTVLAYRPSFLRLLVAQGADLTAPCGRRNNGVLEWPVHVCVSGVLERVTEAASTDDVLETLDYLIAAGAGVDAVDDWLLKDLPFCETALITALATTDMSLVASAVTCWPRCP